MRIEKYHITDLVEPDELVRRNRELDQVLKKLERKAFTREERVLRRSLMAQLQEGHNMHSIVMHERVDVVAAALEAGVPVDGPRDSDNRTLLLMACKLNHWEEELQYRVPAP